jgi:hypothetical protein
MTLGSLRKSPIADAVQRTASTTLRKEFDESTIAKNNALAMLALVSCLRNPLLDRWLADS